MERIASRATLGLGARILVRYFPLVKLRVVCDSVGGVVCHTGVMCGTLLEAAHFGLDPGGPVGG